MQTQHSPRKLRGKEEKKNWINLAALARISDPSLCGQERNSLWNWDIFLHIQSCHYLICAAISDVESDWSHC